MSADDDFVQSVYEAFSGLVPDDSEKRSSVIALMMSESTSVLPIALAINRLAVAVERIADSVDDAGRELEQLIKLRECSDEPI